MAENTEALKQQQATEESAEALSLLDGIMQETTNLQKGEEGYAETVKGMELLVTELLKKPKGERVNKVAVDGMIAELDKKLSVQLDEILHHPEVQQMESSWTGLKYVVDHVNFRENIKVELLNVSKLDLSEDFEDCAEIMKSGLYKHVYTAEYGQFGGKPVGAMIANYDFNAKAPDIKLMQNVASVGAMAHAPFIAAAGPEFFGEKDFSKLPNMKDLKAVFESPKYTKWQSFRESEDARYMGLTMPRFLLRMPYDPEQNPIRGFQYKENVSGSHEDYLWGNTAFAFATRLADSFAKYRWCPNIIGPQSGGAVEDLNLHQYESMGEIETKIPTEILVSDRREYELAEEGFISLTMRKGSDNAAFFSANTVQKPKFYGISPEGKEAETNYKLGTQLPYMFIMNRLAHYIKVLQREEIGSWKERADLEAGLNKWIRQYVADQDNPSAEVRSRKPLRQAKIEVEDVEGEPGWYRVGMKVRPHFKYMGADFTLSLVGKLDKE
ncbi:MAG: type VI secretion system contractile sheath large subunit [Gammaproteobacteria bacterium]|nr:type VI secretion system contractile sheath large subunit [Gammaproteobacteria bacterium]